VKFDGEIKRMPMDHIRRSIAEHMVASAHTSPHVTSVHEVNVTGIMDYIEKNQASFRQREGVKLTPTAFVVQAAAKALKEFPAVNASIDGTDIIYHKKINIGVAVALEQGLIVPVVRNADTLSISGISKAVNDLAARARTKKLNPDEVQGGTFSITNFGVFDTVMAAPIINQPQVAILGMGSAKQRVVVVDGMIAIRWMMYLSLTYDHRLLDGAQGGQFLQRMTEILENVDG
jgi:2-oxoglutarate dehydrogenase E2 component (dihydrolipoamide succinyltransferase)